MRIKGKKHLSIFTLAMINVAAISSVKNWPFIAEYGLSSAFYLILAALLFFVPISLVCAELATGWPKKGGVYLWVKEAFGKRWGFLAVWLQWVENVVWYPTILSFAASTLTYIWDPKLSSSTVFTVVAVLCLFWLATLVNIYGMKISGWVSKIGAICGTLAPALIIITLGVFWLMEGLPLQVNLSPQNFLPEFSWSNLVFFTGVVLAFGGMEMSSVHALEVDNPKKNYPKAILLSAILIVLPTLLGVLSISIVVPKEQLSLTAGTMQAFSLFLNQYGLKAFIPLVSAMMAIGLFGSVSTWIIGPTKGLLAAGEEELLPPLFRKKNVHGAPVSLLLFQGFLVTILTLMFLLMPTVSSGFWILTVLVAQLYLLMYLLVFAAAIYLRYKKPNTPRPYFVRGKRGNWGMWVACVLGTLSSLFALLIGYFPPKELQTGNPIFYTGFLISATLIGCLAPVWISRKRLDRNKPKGR